MSIPKELIEVRDAISVKGFPVGLYGEDFTTYKVGQPYSGYADGRWKQKLGTVSRITVTEDLPGLHCNMERVRVWDDDMVIAEMPLHNLELVCYT